MILHVKPTQQLSGKIFLPASKSYSIRAFIVGACGGVSQIIDPSNCDDALVAIRVARSLGCKITRKKNCWHLVAGKASSNIAKISVGESGTVLRLLLPLLSTRTQRAVVVGERTLIGRPNGHLLKALRQQGLDIGGTGKEESVPIHYKGGSIHSGKIIIDGSLSSQFVSALLIAAPALSESSRVVVSGKQMVSRDYITMTMQVLKAAGVSIVPKGLRSFDVSGNQKFLGLKKFHVPSDYGLAAFMLAAGAIIPSDIQLDGFFDDRYIQADGNIMGFLKSMGVKWIRKPHSLVLKGPFALKGGVFSLQDCPDLVPIMAVIALFAKGKTVLKNIYHARAKESDRISDLRRELIKIGAKVEEKKSSLIIHPLKSSKSGVLLDPSHDHRLAMAFAVLGLKVGVQIKDIESSHKSYPDFVRDFKLLGANVSLTQKQ